MLTRNLRNKKARYICIRSFLRFSLRAATSLVFFGFGFGGSGSRARVCLRVEVIFEKQKENAESVNVCISLSRDVVFFFFAFPLAFFCCFFFFGASNRIYRSRPSPRQQQRDATPHSATNRSFFFPTLISIIFEKEK